MAQGDMEPDGEGFDAADLPPLDLPGLFRRVRRRSDLSQRDAARRLGVSPATVAKAELDGSSMSFQFVVDFLALAAVRLVALDARGEPVTHMRSDAARDRAGRRYPAHLDTERPGAKPPTSASVGRVAPVLAFHQRPIRDFLRGLRATVQDDHASLRELADAEAARLLASRAHQVRTSAPREDGGVTSDRYTHGHAESVLSAHGVRSAADSAAYLLPHLRAGMSLLDIGCGPGTITLDLARRLAPGRVVGLDVADAALVEARRRAAEAGDTTTTFVEGDVYALDHPDGAFDVVHAHQVLQHLTDPVRALREMARVTRPGGLIAARDADYAAMTWYPESDGLTDWLATYRKLARHNGAEPDAGRRLLSWARAAGLVDIVPSASVWLYADEGSRRWWGSGWAARVRGSSYGSQALAAGLVDPARLAAMEEAWNRWSEHPSGWFVVVHGEFTARAPA